MGWAWIPFRRRRSRLARAARAVAAGRRGLEIGGPSRIFGRRGRLPVYPFLASLDGCDFAPATTWHDREVGEEGYRFDPRRPPGRLIVAEAADLAPVADRAYEALLASHVLEHVANPLRALRAWRRVLASDGVLVLVVPHGGGTFDHRRPVTTYEHLIEDEARGVGEDDLAHLPEILALHDVGRDPGVEDLDAFERRSRENPRNRCLHHHVFDTALAIRAVAHAGFSVEGVDVMAPHHVLLLARAGGPGPQAPDLLAPDLLAADAPWRRRSPFSRDR